ncbi:30S ribosomal protein S27ae [Candidatus Bathyarchaeota archaeon]|nr:30S ribosomal protein S27ae [Candidatus Bathyarchaeota archaeon]
MSEEKSKTPHKNKVEKKIYTYYDIKEGKISRRLKKCPRCGSFMASHKGPQQRWTCGNCSYTEFVAAKPR